jgi:hypothetical protein
MGTLRHEKEAAEASERAFARLEAERKRRELELAEAEASTRIAMLQRELEARQAELARLREEEKTREQQWRIQQEGVQRLRAKDEDSGSADVKDRGDV